VCTPKEAIDTFIFAKLDLLVAGNFFVTPQTEKSKRM
jgi:predicted NodU family carbamoyl transferase